MNQLGRASRAMFVLGLSCASAGAHAQTAPVPRDLAGVKLGDKTDTLHEICRKNGWKCTSKRRTKRGRNIERVTIDLPSGDYHHMVVVARDGVIFSAKAAYRATRKTRATDLAKLHGSATHSLGRSAIWMSHDYATRMAVSASGKKVDLLGLDVAPKELLHISSVLLTTSNPLIANLYIDAPSHLILYEGQPAELGIEVKNALKAPSSASSVSYKLFSALSTTPSETKSLAVPALPASGSARMSIKLGTLALGLYRVELQVGVAKKIVPILLAKSGPDFRIAELQTPSSAKPDEEITIKARVYNAGLKSSTQPWKVTFTSGGNTAVAASTKKLEIAQGNDSSKSEWVSAKLKFRPTSIGENVDFTARVSSNEDIHPGNNKTSKTVFSVAPPTEYAKQERVAVKIRVDKLRCNEPYDYFGDSPLMFISGLHSADGHGWDAPKWTYDELEEEQEATVNRTLFSDNDKRRFVSTGESVSLHASLWDRDWATDDSIAKLEDIDPLELDYNEIDYVDEIFDFNFLRSHQNETLHYNSLLTFPDSWRWSIDGAEYELHYTLEIGAVSPLPNPTSELNPALWAGAYEAVLDGHKATVNLIYKPGTATNPFGSLVGTWNETGKAPVPITHRDLASNRWVFSVGEGTSYTAYLIGSSKELKTLGIAGSATTDGNEYGFFMTRKP